MTITPAQALAEPVKQEPRYLTIAAAADYLSVSTKTFRAWITCGFIRPVDLPTVKGTGANRFVRIDRIDLNALMQKRKVVSR